ncbi:MAG TPA: DEAD/DEAH box helicase [Thermoplasmata archaeon]|nr:DEAD/DEAH box helicase [Thermoplasmata archaeon]
MLIRDLPLDQRVIEILEGSGFRELYPPQAEAMPLALSGQNLVVSIPTASGKSLIAYCAILDQILKGGKALYIVPLRALAREKFDELAPFRRLGIKIGIATGDFDRKESHLGRNHIIICTSEKADSLLRHRTTWLSELKVVVADEVHLINDPSRGPTLEVTLTRFKALNPEAQIIALSATIKNAGELAEWLDANLVQSEWRPVELRKGVFDGSTVDFTDNKSIPLPQRPGIDSISFLVEDTIKQGGQALVFVNTRRSANALAKKVGGAIRPVISEKEREEAANLSNHVLNVEREKTSLGKSLADCVREGCAFHHAGLGSEQRRVVEQAFREGKIKCVVATPTLAAGMNLPARRVIVRDLWRYAALIGMAPIPRLEIHQMMGRAGRPHLDPYGEAVLVARHPEEKERIREEYLLGDVEPIHSKLGSESALRFHLLAAIASGFTRNRQELNHFIGSTFYSYQTEAYWLESQLDGITDFLLDNDFIVENEEQFKPTLFGVKTSELYIDPLSALKMKEAILSEKASRGEPLSFLHVIASTPDMRLLSLRRTDEWILEKLDEFSNFLLEKPEPETAEMDLFLPAFKTALLLEDWINEESEENITKRYGIGPGDIHAEVELAQWLLYALREIARLLYIGELMLPLTNLNIRIRNGCKAELLPLIQLEQIGRVRGRALYNAGFRTLNSLRKAPEESLARIPTIGKEIARTIKRQVTRVDHIQTGLKE